MILGASWSPEVAGRQHRHPVPDCPVSSAGMIAGTFHRPLRVTVAVLWLVGVLLAGGTAPLAAAGLGAGRAAVFALVAVGLAALALATLRGIRWVLVLDLVLLGGQAVGAVGAVLELIYEVDPAKAADLRAVGYDPQLSVAVNAGYCTVATGVFVWALVRLIRARQTRLG